MDDVEVSEALNRIGIAISADLDLSRAVETAVHSATELTGAAFGAFFYNVIDELGEKYTLYALSGVPHEAFKDFPMPRNTAVFGPTFEGSSIVRSDDITQDPRYGHNKPYHGMPPGHLPVRSYLAVPVINRQGEVLGGLFFGHPQPGVFTERAERLVAGIAEQAAVSITNARLFAASRREQQNLRDTNETLRQHVDASVFQLQQSEQQFSLLVSGVVDYAIYMLDTTGRVVTWNKGAERIKGYSSEEIIGQDFTRFYTEEDQRNNLPAIALTQARLHGRHEMEGWRVRSDGTRFWASVVLDAIYDDGQLVGFAKITRDMTERRKVEEQLRQAQKMEAIGQLTGGVAHDFNNLLIVILGNLETLQRQLQHDEIDVQRLKRSADGAMRGARRAASLTQRLLAFSRRQPLEPKPVDVNKLVANMSELLRRTLGEQISIETVHAGGLWKTHADPNQLESAILNLAVNARDAMPEGGRLTIETANAHLDEGYVSRQVEVAPGQYVVLAITDTGVGMTREVLTQAFEPFFTTKDVGHGTGLGLAQVYGFVKQTGGHVKIYSEVGQGTTVRIYLPRLLVDQAIDLTEHSQEDSTYQHHGQTILVVEDDTDVRAHSTEILMELGYRVLQAGEAQTALNILEREPVQMLFTDVGLPGGMNGRQLAEKALQRNPHLKVLFTTGYARNAIIHDGRLDPGLHLITKPFTYNALQAKVHELLEADDGPRTILVVEDIEPVRLVAVDMLESLGFQVIEAANATEALVQLRVAGTRIAGAVIDVGLPDRRGDVLAAELRSLNIALPIIIASGYGEDTANKLQQDTFVRFLTKPYDTEQLKATLRELGLESRKDKQ